MYLIRGKNINNNFTKINPKLELEGVVLPRALESFREQFEKLLPYEVLSNLRKKVETFVVRDEAS